MKTIEDYMVMPEGQTYDRNSARIETKALSVIMVAMANADGGMYREMGKVVLPNLVFKQDDLGLHRKLHQNFTRNLVGLYV